MDILDIEILFDEIGAILTAKGKSPNDIRDFFTEEGDRVAQEIEDQEEV